MAKRKRRKGRARRGRTQTSPEILRRQGADAFRRGDYEMAIAAWRRVSRSERDAQLAAAFAEACFRRGLSGHLDSMRQAASISEEEPRYLYHLALIHHRSGRPAEAEPLYRRVLDKAGESHDIGPRAAYALGLLLLEANRRPSHDAFWGWLKEAADDSPLAQTRERLAWAEELMFDRSAPSGPAPDPLWQALGDRRANRDDQISITPDTAVAHSHLAARAWDRRDAEGAFTHWCAAYDGGLSYTEGNVFAAARTVATQRLEENDAAGALGAAAAGLAVEPDDNALKTIAGQAHFRLGYDAAVAGDWEEAYTHWQAALNVGGERSRRLVINLALAEEQREDWHQAAELWREALRRRPRKANHPDALDDSQVARLWRHVAESYYRAGQTDEALKTFRNALKWAPDDAELRTGYVDLLLDDGRLVAAENQLNDLLHENPNELELLERRAQVFTAQGYSHDALRDLNRILELQPDHPSARRQIARHYEMQGDTLYEWGRLQEAIALYQQGLEYDPENGMLLVSIGMCHLDMDANQLARQFFDRAFTVDPANESVYVLAIQSWLGHTDVEAAQEVIQRARAARELSPGFFLELADYCYSWQLPDLARDYIRESKILAADDADLLVIIAECAGRNGDFALALEILEDALKVDPDHAGVYLVQGLALVSQGELKAARRSWNRAERIARKTNNEVLLMAVEELRTFYDPKHGPSLGFLRRMLRGATFEDDEWLDDDEEWFWE
jgi:tetratricopeptide (TPR) repeat protein